MALSKTMEEAIAEKNFGKIYSSFYTVLLSDPGFSTGRFEQTFAEVKARNIEGFLQSYNGKAFKSEEEWNGEYWDIVAFELMDNFCLERINHLKEVGKKVYPPVERQTQKTTTANTQGDAQKKTASTPVSQHQKNGNIVKVAGITAVTVIILVMLIVLLR